MRLRHIILLNLWALRKLPQIPPVVYALCQHEVNDHALLTALEESVIEGLVYLEYDPMHHRVKTYQVAQGHKALICITKAFKHYKVMGTPNFDWLTVTPEEFDHFRTHGYVADFSKQPFPLTPLHTPGTPMMVGSHIGTTDTAVSRVEQWQKGVKHDPEIYPELKVDSQWNDWIDKVQIYASYHDVEEVLDP
jgi:hypothetical protein